MNNKFVYTVQLVWTAVVNGEVLHGDPILMIADTKETAAREAARHQNLLDEADILCSIDANGLCSVEVPNLVVYDAFATSHAEIVVMEHILTTTTE